MAATILSGMLASESEEGGVYADEYSEPLSEHGWKQDWVGGVSYGKFIRVNSDGLKETFTPVIIKTRDQKMAEIAVGTMNELCEVLAKNEKAIQQQEADV